MEQAEGQFKSGGLRNKIDMNENLHQLKQSFYKNGLYVVFKGVSGIHVK